MPAFNQANNNQKVPKMKEIILAPMIPAAAIDADGDIDSQAWRTFGARAMF